MNWQDNFKKLPSFFWKSTYLVELNPITRISESFWMNVRAKVAQLSMIVVLDLLTLEQIFLFCWEWWTKIPQLDTVDTWSPLPGTPGWKRKWFLISQMISSESMASSVGLMAVFKGVLAISGIIISIKNGKRDTSTTPDNNWSIASKLHMTQAGKLVFMLMEMLESISHLMF